QGGIDAAVNGDTVLVAPGTYYENLNFKGKGVHLKSEDGPNSTCLRKLNQGSILVFVSNESNNSVVEGFEFYNGNALTGGAIYCFESSPMIINNIFYENNSTYRGGAIYCWYYSSPVIRGNKIIENTADENGGGIYCGYSSSPIIEDSLFRFNSTVGEGGAIYVHNSSPKIINNIIEENRATNPGGTGIGSGIQCIDCPHVEISYNVISNNESNKVGSAIYCKESSVNMHGNVIQNHNNNYGPIWFGNSEAILLCNRIKNNVTPASGAGISLSGSNLKMYNNIITENYSDNNGGAISAGSSALLIVNNTICNNYSILKGGAINCGNSTLEIVNSILWGNNSSAGGEEIWIGVSSEVTISYSDISNCPMSIFVEHGGVLNWGPGNLSEYPEIVSYYEEDYHISNSSPCRDTGNNSVVSESYDFEGDPRISVGLVDMGADEFHPHLYYTGIPEPNGDIKLKFVGIPDDTVRLWVGSGVLDPPLNFPYYGDWYLEAPILLGMILGNIPVDGVYVLPVNIPPDYTPWDIPLQAGIGTVLSNLCVVGVE
ncbi:MAG: right-handed parallel beta-helix repeat-containing protein, partial [bacterium]